MCPGLGIGAEGCGLIVCLEGGEMYFRSIREWYVGEMVGSL